MRWPFTTFRRSTVTCTSSGSLRPRTSEAEIVDFTRAVAEVAGKAGLSESGGGNGYRTLSNAGPDGHQEVPHFHVHVFGGGFLGKMIDFKG